MSERRILPTEDAFLNALTKVATVGLKSIDVMLGGYKANTNGSNSGPDGWFGFTSSEAGPKPESKRKAFNTTPVTFPIRHR